MALKYQVCPSPMGDLYLVADGLCLVAVVFADNWKLYRSKLDQVVLRSCQVLEQTQTQLQEYFEGRRREFSMSLDLRGTEFQKKAWTALAEIPYGHTATYGEQARMLQSPKAVRAVGRANGQNPLSIVLPCHRVIGASGKLTGYGGGLGAKEFLLRLEGAIINL